MDSINMDHTQEQEHFKELFERAKKLRSRYLQTLATFRIYDRFKKLSAPNIVGKRRAEANAKVFADYVYFFSPVQEATRCYFFIELSKFFDKNKRRQSLTIDYVLDYALENLASFSKAEFEKYHSERNIIPELLQGYKPFVKRDVQRLKRRIKKHGDFIENLNTYRNKFLAHDDLEKVEVKITIAQIRTILNIIKDTIDLLYYKLEFASNSYMNFDKEPVRAVDRVVRNLQEYEKERLKEIKKKYGL